MKNYFPFKILQICYERAQFLPDARDSWKVTGGRYNYFAFSPSFKWNWIGLDFIFGQDSEP